MSSSLFIILLPILAPAASAIGMALFRRWKGASLFSLLSSLVPVAWTLYLRAHWPPEVLLLTPENGPLAAILSAIRLDSWSVTLVGITGAFAFFSQLFLRSYYLRSPLLTEILKYSCVALTSLIVTHLSNHIFLTAIAIQGVFLGVVAMISCEIENKKNAPEAAFKYFTFNSLALAFWLLGCALLFSHFKTFLLSDLTELIRTYHVSLALPQTATLTAFVCFVISLFIHMGLFPFHHWTPDVHEGIPSAVAGFMDGCLKLMGLGLSLKLFGGLFSPLWENWTSPVSWLCVVGIFACFSTALIQDDLKRLLSFSSSSHAGFVILALCASRNVEPHLLLYYLIGFGTLFVGLFGWISYIRRETHNSELYQLSGMGFSHPVLGICLGLLAISGACLPPTAGFLSKIHLASTFLESRNLTFLVLAGGAQVIGSMSYLRVISYLYFKESRGSINLGQPRKIALVGILGTAFFSIALALFPEIVAF